MNKDPFELAADEVIIRDCIASLQKFGMFVGTNHLYLTNLRIVVTRSSKWWLNPLQYLLMKLKGMEKFNILINLPINEIQGFYRVKYGINKNVLGIKTRDGQTYKLALTQKYFEWQVYLMSRKLPDLHIDFQDGF